MRTSSEGETGSLKQQTAGNFPIIFLKLQMFPLKNSNAPWVIVQLQSCYNLGVMFTGLKGSDL